MRAMLTRKNNGLPFIFSSTPCASRGQNAIYRNIANFTAIRDAPVLIHPPGFHQFGAAGWSLGSPRGGDAARGVVASQSLPASGLDLCKHLAQKHTADKWEAGKEVWLWRRESTGPADSGMYNPLLQPFTPILRSHPMHFN